jgi:hypothetical protein
LRGFLLNNSTSLIRGHFPNCLSWARGRNRGIKKGEGGKERRKKMFRVLTIRKEDDEREREGKKVFRNSIYQKGRKVLGEPSGSQL